MQSGWTPLGPGLARGPSGEIWRSWREFGEQGGTFPNRRARKAIGQRHAEQARAAEHRFGIQLRHIARQINQIIRGIFNPADPADPGWQSILDALDQYRAIISPWAQQVVWRMLADVSRRDLAGWHALGRQMSFGLRQHVEQVDMAQAIEEMYNYQVAKILELPDNASEQIRQSREFSANIVRQMRQRTISGEIAGTRWGDLVQHVYDTGLHVQSSANTVARTETARAASIIQTVRAQGIGSEGFIWRTSLDKDVRPLHRKLEGRFFTWAEPPILDDGKPGLPGTIWNCRCWSEVVLPDLPT
jgi:SPP1 gp7 family putative phage head morphogenesis protein